MSGIHPHWIAPAPFHIADSGLRQLLDLMPVPAEQQERSKKKGSGTFKLLSCSPCRLDGGFRVFVDYRRLNPATIRDQYIVNTDVESTPMKKSGHWKGCRYISSSDILAARL